MTLFEDLLHYTTRQWQTGAGLSWSASLSNSKSTAFILVVASAFTSWKLAKHYQLLKASSFGDLAGPPAYVRIFVIPTCSASFVD